MTLRCLLIYLLAIPYLYVAYRIAVSDPFHAILNWGVLHNSPFFKLVMCTHKL